MLNYLSYLFDSGFQYRTIDCHRSAISAYHDYVDNEPVGQHPHVCALLKGVFNHRPPQPRYAFNFAHSNCARFYKIKCSECEKCSDKLHKSWKYGGTLPH